MASKNIWGVWLFAPSSKHEHEICWWIGVSFDWSSYLSMHKSTCRACTSLVYNPARCFQIRKELLHLQSRCWGERSRFIIERERLGPRLSVMLLLDHGGTRAVGYIVFTPGRVKSGCTACPTSMSSRASTTSPPLHCMGGLLQVRSSGGVDSTC